MKKIIVGGLILFFACLGVFAGDAAVLVDNGFSADGKYYIFGQYGKTDKSFQGWAEIFTVDIEENDYVDGEFYKIKPSSVTAEKTGKEVYESLASKNFYNLKKYGCKPCEPDQILYIRELESKGSTEEIVFKDFSSSVAKDQGYYHVRLVPTIYGSGTSVKSSFYIDLEKQDAKGNVLARQTVGSPRIVRKGVSNYKIERIVCDKSGKNLVFVIEKTSIDKTGINIRYMIEAVKLSDSFFENLAPVENVIYAGEEETSSEDSFSVDAK